MNKDYWFGIGAVLLAVVVGAWLFTNPAESPSNGNPNPTSSYPAPSSPGNNPGGNNPPTSSSSGINVNASASINIAPQIKEFTVLGNSFSFTPSTFRVQKGDIVKINFANQGGFHDLVVSGYNRATPQIQAGGTATLEFIADKSGSFPIYCSVGNHRAQGMEGMLVVEG